MKVLLKEENVLERKGVIDIMYDGVIIKPSLDEALEHYGVKGMKWKKRKKGRKLVSKLFTTETKIDGKIVDSGFGKREEKNTKDSVGETKKQSVITTTGKREMLKNGYKEPTAREKADKALKEYEKLKKKYNW